MSEQPSDRSAFYQLSPGRWDEIDAATRSEVVKVETLLAASIEAADSGPSPLEVALALNQLASQIFEQIARDERDLRQVISTLRTAHAVAWDMYDAVKAERTTVAKYMSDLRENIDSFESDLADLQRERASTAS